MCFSLCCAACHSLFELLLAAVVPEMSNMHKQIHRVPEVSTLTFTLLTAGQVYVNIENIFLYLSQKESEGALVNSKPDLNLFCAKISRIFFSINSADVTSNTSTSCTLPCGHSWGFPAMHSTSPPHS